MLEDGGGFCWTHRGNAKKHGRPLELRDRKNSVGGMITIICEEGRAQ